MDRGTNNTDPPPGLVAKQTNPISVSIFTSHYQDYSTFPYNLSILSGVIHLFHFYLPSSLLLSLVYNFLSRLCILDNFVSLRQTFTIITRVWFGYLTSHYQNYSTFLYNSYILSADLGWLIWFSFIYHRY